MGVFILAGFIAGLVIIALMFTRGGAKEPVSRVWPDDPRSTPAPTSTRAELEELTRRAIAGWGLRIERFDPNDEKDSFGVLAADPTPITGGKVYVRAFANAVNEADVQAQLDAARDEGVSKLILISQLGFSDEAILAAQDTIAELVDGRVLAAASSTGARAQFALADATRSSA